MEHPRESGRLDHYLSRNAFPDLPTENSLNYHCFPSFLGCRADKTGRQQALPVTSTEIGIPRRRETLWVGKVEDHPAEAEAGVDFGHRL